MTCPECNADVDGPRPFVCPECGRFFPELRFRE